MLTPLQQRKLSYLFSLDDADKDGAVERTDFERNADRLATSVGRAPGTPGYDQVRARYLDVWATLERRADTNRDGKVSLDEYLAAYADILAELGAAARGFVQVLFDFADADEDGRIAEGEYLALVGAYAVAADAARESFRRLDRDGDGFIRQDEFLQAAEDFFVSDDPNAPGTWLFGPLPA